jgi:hypothetical protein
MRKAQNVVKFGLKVGTFAGLAAALSSCLIVVDPGPPTIAFVSTPTTYCRADGIARSDRLDFTFDVTNLDNATVQAIVSADAFSDVSDPTTIAQDEFSSTNVTTVSNPSGAGAGRYNASVTLSLSSTGTLLSIKAIKPVPSAIRLWIQAINKTGQTNWAKSPIINAVTCP